ncbi:aminopeptidase [candidate division WWE3 bacterium CG08_land_8_20_14_0_20_40_13]|uniref:Aminopeptidase n=1 Tax=candidate division WWE3 bacterium CG08_land_8_20_14_0_20_40_13 TaxID=1975084 RepID=A0A2H0XEM1_UNCKA|nr:MAG: aminopeptidase [candidate division WWE3 bacterium CG08_land_8_20_14_0_20_40_13]
MAYSSGEQKLARVILNHSLSIKPREKVLITAANLASYPLAKEVFVEALKLGAYPLIDEASFPGLSYQFFSLANNWQLNYIPREILKAKTEWADAYVKISSPLNSKELNQIDSKKIFARAKLTRPFADKIIDSDRWLYTEYPTPSMAQDAGVSLDWLMDFYFNACLVDYNKMEKELLALEKVLDKGHLVRVVGKDTDISFSVKGRLAKACFGERNLPDGEVFSAPVTRTAEGRIYFEFSAEYFGKDVEGIYLEFKKGRVVKAKAEMGEEILNEVLSSDAGAKSLGEFAIGANYNIKVGMKNALFDEKIGGTVHLALGRSYKEERGGAPSFGNDSAVHWDLVKDTRTKGSYVELDGKKILVGGKILL